MVRICIVAMIGAVVLVSSWGCGQQGAGNNPSGSTEQQATTSPRESPEPLTTIPVDGGVLECPSDGGARGATVDYASGAKGKKGDPVEIARREFPKKIREGDTIVAERSRNPYPMTTVRVIREGRVVAIIKYTRAGGGWLKEDYMLCTSS